MKERKKGGTNKERETGREDESKEKIISKKIKVREFVGNRGIRLYTKS